jgi:arabinofuranosyltransferase
VLTRRWLRPDVLIPLLAVVVRLVPGPREIDDAFITFRYARNFLSGHGLVFNPGEPVFGITTPLFVSALILLALLTGGAEAPFSWLALGLSSAADAGTCWLLLRIGETLGSRTAGTLAALVWAVSPMSVTFAIGGMETSLFVLLLAATLYFHLKGQPVRSALSAGLSLVTRPDGILMALPVALDRLRAWLRGRPVSEPSARRPIAEAVAFLAPAAVWSIFATAAYGSPIPHSVVAKAAAYHLPREAALVRLLQHISTPFIEHEVLGLGWIAVGLVLYPALFGLGAAAVLRRRRDAWPLFAFPLLYLAAYAIANPLIFRWYLAPPLPFYFLGIFLGVDRLARDLRRPAVAWVFGVAAFALTLHAWNLAPDHGPRRPAPDMAFIRLELVYAESGRSLAPRLTPDDVVAAGDIGVLGFVTDARILDLVGLVSPSSAAYYPLTDAAYVINFAASSDLIADQQPDYVVLLEVYGRRTLLVDPRFLENYELIETFPTDLYGSEGMLVFHRVES